MAWMRSTSSTPCFPASSKRSTASFGGISKNSRAKRELQLWRDLGQDVEQYGFEEPVASPRHRRRERTSALNE